MTEEYVRPRHDSPPGPNYEWYSVCSAHIEYKEDCGNCNAGSWISLEEIAKTRKDMAKADLVAKSLIIVGILLMVVGSIVLLKHC